MITDDVFALLKTVDRNLTENEFTTKYLRTSRSYLCNRRNKGKDVSNDVLLNLYSELANKELIWRRAASQETDSTRKRRWHQMAELHSALVERVVHSVLERARR